jgi:hypothetical protein
MMTRGDIEQAFSILSGVLENRGVCGEIGIVGGAAMCLAYDARESTKDVDGIFRPSKEVRDAALEVARTLGLDDDWLNDGAKGYLPGEPAEREVIWQSASLIVWAPPADYLLAMKVAASRVETFDADDILCLAARLGIKTAEQVMAVAVRYYGSRVPQKAHYLVDELFSQ